MNSSSNRIEGMTKNKPNSLKNKNSSLPLYQKIEEIINAGKKDTGRLYHILNSLKEGKAPLQI